MIRNNLDVMHIEKNVCDNILGTLLNIEGKSKDNLKAQLDLKKIGKRSGLHPIELPNGRMHLPPACYTMSSKEKDLLLGVLKGTKVPGNYSSNISRCVKVKQRKLIGLKSHDCHVLMQDLLPIAIRGSLPKNVSQVIIDLCHYFREIYLKVLKVSHPKELEKKKKSVTQCQMEKIFPLGFFTIMVQLVTHLENEAD